MRVTGGHARGISIELPRSLTRLRPATDRNREAVFASLGERVEGARVLDLFAGTGAYGIEALSRSASHVTFVESHAPACALIRANLARLEPNLPEVSKISDVRKADALRPLPGLAGVDLVFVDPPYDRYPEILGPLRQIVLRCVEGSPSPRVIIECPGALTIDWPDWTTVKTMGTRRHDPGVRILAKPSL